MSLVFQSAANLSAGTASLKQDKATNSTTPMLEKFIELPAMWDARRFSEIPRIGTPIAMDCWLLTGNPKLAIFSLGVSHLRWATPQNLPELRLKVGNLPLVPLQHFLTAESPTKMKRSGSFHGSLRNFV